MHLLVCQALSLKMCSALLHTNLNDNNHAWQHGGCCDIKWMQIHQTHMRKIQATHQAHAKQCLCKVEQPLPLFTSPQQTEADKNCIKSIGLQIVAAPNEHVLEAGGTTQDTHERMNTPPMSCKVSDKHLPLQRTLDIGPLSFALDCVIASKVSVIHIW